MEIAHSTELFGISNSSRNPQRRGKIAEEPNGIKATSATIDLTRFFVETDGVFETKALVSELCHQFYGLGWVSGTGGSVTIRVHDDEISKSSQLIVISPSGVQKERMMPEDMYVLSSEGVVLSKSLSKPYPYGSPKCSDCTPLFLQAYEICNAGAVVHSHGIEACLATMIQPLMKEFRITHMEMIKGIKGHGYHDELVIPIIENTAKEGELIESFTEAIRSYPKSTAVLVRNHGVYVWGDTWMSAKTQAECYHYLFDAAVKLYQLGVDWSTPDHGSLHNSNRVSGLSGKFGRVIRMESLDPVNMVNHQQLFILLGIEGTTTHIPLSADVLSSYKNDKFSKHLVASNGNDEDISMVFKDVPQSNDIAGLMFEDVPVALKKWHTSGIKVYVISRCSRQVQHRLFGHSSHGDLRKYLSGYFDSTLGSKNETQTYKEILLTVGVDRPPNMLYVTNNIQEAFAARAAGLEAILTIRTGNEPLKQNHGFRTIQSLIDIC